VGCFLAEESESGFAGSKAPGIENSFVELLSLPLVSGGKLGFRLKNGCSIGESFGDS
jgi:hypothetical protein